ncbi:MAG: PD40 domain-containing protein [Deltaproteobacteria bacterium]|nr:PD40 domain-containing protein [Nannocystaceae bacterium]
MLVLSACTLDTSGVGDGDEGSSSAAEVSSGGSGPTTTTTSTSTPTSSPTTGTLDDSSGPTTAGPTTESSETSASGDHGSESDESTGDVEPEMFGEPVAVPNINSDGIDDDPTLTGDMLEIYFSSTRDGQPSEDIYRATRTRLDEDFTDVMRVGALSRDDSADASPEISLDGLLIRFSGSWPGGSGGNDPMLAHRANRNAVWSMPLHIDELSTGADEASLVTTSNGLTGYFCRDFGGGPYWDLLRTVRDDDMGDWEMPMSVDELNGDGRDCAPWVDADETELWFTSVRAGGLGQEDIWRVAVDDGLFGEPEPVTELNGLGIDEDPWLSPDGNTVYFASDRADGNFAIYMATRD